jgi:acyl-coenzyme A synthetase/AMP-(fatty) acid ligase/acyl carrier protein
VVSEASLGALAGELADEVIAIDSQAAATSQPITAVPVSADTPAYVLHTSGTTGEPKAVTQTRRGLLSQVARYVAGAGITAEDRLSLVSSLGFDAAVQDVFGALLVGASLHPVDLRDAGSGAAVADALVSAGVTVFHATPSVYRFVFGDELSCRHELDGIRAVVLGGEVARRSDWTLFCTRFARGTRLVNGYGLTESTVVSQWQGDHDSRVAGELLPLGWPVAGVEVELIDASGQPSWQGEIVLRGAGLAEADESGVYRTGDLGRWQADGQLAWVGRNDKQLKLNGVRVQPGEVEAVLERGPGVTGCAVLGREVNGEMQLVAWVAGLEDAQAQERLKAWARDELSPWQWPGAWQRLDALPLKANGKLDPGRLPEPGRPAGTRPVGELETALAGLWAELLGVEAVRREDDFFALGGHSLMATRLIARIRQEFGSRISLLMLFENPTVSGLARAIVDATDAAAEAESPVLRRLERDKTINAGNQGLGG